MLKSINLFGFLFLLVIVSCDPKSPEQPQLPDVICTCEYSNLIYSKGTSYLWAPNCFTPNSDGMNDQFHVLWNGMDSTHFSMKIYNPAQSEIFSTTDIHASWTGPATYTSGNYPVIVKYQNAEGSIIEKRFCIYILPYDNVNHCFKTGGATGLNFEDQFNPAFVQPTFTTNETLCN